GECGGGTRSENGSVEESDDPGSEAEDRDDLEERTDTHAGSPHCGDFAVGSHAAEADEDSHQDAHGDGHGERGGHDEEENFRHAGHGSAVADHELQQAADIAHEDDESEDSGP